MMPNKKTTNMHFSITSLDELTQDRRMESVPIAKIAFNCSDAMDIIWPIVKPVFWAMKKLSHEAFIIVRFVAVTRRDAYM